MHVTMVKKRLSDGSECRKCVEATDFLKGRGLWDRVDEVVWAIESDADSAGMRLGSELGVDLAPFFIVRGDGAPDRRIYTSVLQLVRDRLDRGVSAADQAKAVDVDDIGGI